VNRDILLFHINNIVKFRITSLIVGLLVALILVLNTDIKNKSYEYTITSKKIPKKYIVEAKDGTMYSVDINEKDILNRDFISSYDIEYETQEQEKASFSISKYFNKLFNYDFKRSYNKEIKQTDFLICYIIFITMFLRLIYLYIKDLKLHLLTRNFNFYNTIGSEDKPKKDYDKFIKRVANKLIFKSNSKINYENYLKNLESIKQYLNINHLEVERYKNNSVVLIIPKIPSLLNFDRAKLQTDKIYMGIDKNLEDYYINLNELTHSITVAETGAGKSTFIQNILLSLFKNHNQVESFYLIDPKRAEFGRYKKLKKVIYADNEAKILKTFQKLQKTMYERFDEMQSDSIDGGDVIYQNGGYIFTVFDEFGTLGTISNKNIKKELESIIIDIAQKARRAKIILIFIGQSAKTTSIPSTVLGNISSRGIMKTKDPDNIAKMVGNTEELKEANINPKEFNRGRLYFKNGFNGDNVLLQSPFFDLSNKEHLQVLKGIVKDLIVEENTPSFDIKIDNLWQKTKTINDKELASLIRKEIQRLKRDIKSLSNEEIESRIKEIEKLY